MFNSYFENPSGISFEGQEPGEKVILFLRQHFVVLISWFVVVTLMSLVPFAFFGLVSFFEVDITTVISGPYWIVATLLWFLITFGVLFEKLVSWFNNTYILTNERIIDVDFHNLLSKKVSYAHLDNIEDVSQAVDSVQYTKNGSLISSRIPYVDSVWKSLSRKKSGSLRLFGPGDFWNKNNQGEFSDTASTRLKGFGQSNQVWAGYLGSVQTAKEIILRTITPKDIEVRKE